MRLPDVGGVPVKIRGIVIIPLPEPLPRMLASSRGGDSLRTPTGWGRRANKDKRRSFIPLPEPLPHLLASSRGGDSMRACRMHALNTHKLVAACE